MNDLYRKKPVVIHAHRWNPSYPPTSMPDWLWSYVTANPHLFNDSGNLTIRTLEGDMTACPGDWIIRGVKGELYPCKPDIFAATYEPAHETASATAPTPADLAEAAEFREVLIEAAKCLRFEAATCRYECESVRADCYENLAARLEAHAKEGGT